jgi:hypothetical protein
MCNGKCKTRCDKGAVSCPTERAEGYYWIRCLPVGKPEIAWYHIAQREERWYITGDDYDIVSVDNDTVEVLSPRLTPPEGI